MTQSGLWTVRATLTFEECVEKRCARRHVDRVYLVDSEEGRRTHADRSRAAMEHIRRRNALTKLELLHHPA